MVIDGGWKEGRGVKTPADRRIQFEGGGPNWLHTMDTREDSQI